MKINNIIQFHNQKQKRENFQHTVSPFNQTRPDSLELSAKQVLTFRGLFDFWKKKSALEPTQQPQKEVELPEIKTTEEEPEINSLDDIVGPYVKPTEKQIKYAHNKRLKEVLTYQPKNIYEIEENQELIAKLVNSENFDPDLEIFLPDEDEEATIFDDLKYYVPDYQAVLLVNMFGRDDKPVDEKHKLSYDFIKPLFGKFKKLGVKNPEIYNDKISKFYKKQLEFEKVDEMIVDGLKNTNYNLLIMLRENGISGDTLISPYPQNPDKKITFAEAGALSGNKELERLFPLAQALDNCSKRITDNDTDTEDFKKIFNVIKELPIDEFINVIKDLDNYETSGYLGDTINLILEKSNTCNEKEYNKLKPLIDKCFIKSCENISKKDAIDANDWTLRQFLTANFSPKPFVIEYFRDNILNNNDIDLNYKSPEMKKAKAHSILEIALLPYYSNPIYNKNFIAEILLKGADTVDFKIGASKNVYERIKDYSINEIEKIFIEKIKNKPDSPQRESILNFYKQYYAAGGKSAFSNISDSSDFEFAKLLIEAGVKPDTKDNKGIEFIEQTKTLIDKDGNRLFSKEDVLKHLINSYNRDALTEFVYQEYKQNNQEIRVQLHKLDFDYQRHDTKAFARCDFIHPEDLEKTYKELYRLIKENETPYNLLIISNAKNILRKEFKSIFDKYSKPTLDEQQLENLFLNITDTTLNPKTKLSTAEMEAQKFFANVYYNAFDCNTCEKHLDKIVEMGISNFSIPFTLLKKATKMGIEKFFNEHPDLKDGIYTMKDFMMLCKSEDFFNLEGFNTPINEQEETLIDMLINIPEPQDIKQKIFFVDTFYDKLNYINWNHTDKFGNNYALKAVEAENIQMIKLLQEKNVDFSLRNKFGKNAIELAKVSPNPAIRELFTNIKINSEELTKLAKMGSVSGMEMLLKQDYIDINSKDSNGLNSWLISAQQNKANIADYLRTNPEVDFSAKTKDGDNFALTAVYNNSEDIITDIFPKLTPEQLDINYINTLKGTSVYSIAASDLVSPELFKAILSVKNANPNIYPNAGTPIAFSLITYKNKEKFKILCESGKLDLSAKFLNLSLNDYIKTHMLPATKKEVIDNLSMQKEFLDILEIAIDNNFVNNLKKIVDENGVITLQNINDFLDFPNIKNIIKAALSDSQERIGHLLADIEVTPGNMFNVLNITQRILNLDKDAFTYRDKFGQSAIERALLAENEILYEIIAQNSALTSFDIKEIRKIADNISNQKIKKITSGLKPAERSD